MGVKYPTLNLEFLYCTNAFYQNEGRGLGFPPKLKGISVIPHLDVRLFFATKKDQLVADQKYLKKKNSGGF